MKRAVILADSKITLNDIPSEIIRRAELEKTPLSEIEIDINKGLDLKEIARKEMQRIEGKIIRKTLTMTGWHLTKTAGILGVDRKTLRSKMKDLGINRNFPPVDPAGHSDG
jgi:DNA-binding NtrC family response regulator